MDKYKLFESYSSGVLAKDKRASFESDLANDAQLKSEFYEHLKTQAALDILLEEDVTQVINDIKKDQEITKTGNQFKWKTYMAAAVLAGLLVVGYLFLNPQNAVASTDQLIAEFYKAPLDDGTRGDKVFNALTAKIQETKNKAHSLFQQKKYNEATATFQDVLIMTDGQERERTEWYLILSMLKNSEATASSLLTNLTNNPNHIRHQEAVKLAAALKKK